MTGVQDQGEGGGGESKVWGGGRLVAARLELRAAEIVAGQVDVGVVWCPQGPGEMNEG